MSIQPADLTWTPAQPEDTFGYRLYLLRSELGLTLKEVAALCDLNDKSWSNWEQGHSPRNQLDVVKKIADATGVNRDWLMWGSTSARKRTSDHLQALPSGLDRRYTSRPNRPLLVVVKEPDAD